MHYTATAWQESSAGWFPDQRIWHLKKANPRRKAGIMHYTATAWQESSAGWFPDQRIWHLKKANPLTFR